MRKQIHIVWTGLNAPDKNILKKDKEARDKPGKWQEGLSKGTGSRHAKEGRDERVQEKDGAALAVTRAEAHSVLTKASRLW